MKQFIALTLLITFGISDAFADRSPRRGGNGSSRVERNRGSSSGSGSVRTPRRSSSQSRTRRDNSSTTRTERRSSSSQTRQSRQRRNDSQARQSRQRNNDTQARQARQRNNDRQVRQNRSRNNGRVNTNRRTNRNTQYGNRSNHRPARYRARAYNRYHHSPVSRRYNHHSRWNARRSYFSYVRRNFRNYVYLSWLMYPSSRSNGHYYVDNYPYYVYNGYRHRYSQVDYCNYQLVDKDTHLVVRKYDYQSCASGYNRCAIDRDNRNESSWDNKYFCAEVTGSDVYSDTYNDGYYDNDDYTPINSCDDYDYNNGICYDN